MVSILLHNGVSTQDLPFSHAVAYLKNRENLLEQDAGVVNHGFTGGE